MNIFNILQLKHLLLPKSLFTGKICLKCFLLILQIQIEMNLILKLLVVVCARVETVFDFSFDLEQVYFSVLFLKLQHLK